MDIKQKNPIINFFTKGMWKDSLPSLQPEGTYREAWNAVLETDNENSFGIANEPSNEIHVKMDGDVRGLIFAEERDKYIAFVMNKNKGEIGIIDSNKNTYTKITDSSDIDLSCDEWVDAELKYMQPCNQLHMYFSTNDTYKFLNIDDPCCEFKIKELLKVDCIPSFDFQIYKRGGALPNGTYWFCAKLRDADGNETNWFRISKGIHISGGDHKPGETSKKAINLKLQGLHRDYSLVDIGVISTVGGRTTEEHVDTISYGEGKVDYLYRGRTGRELPLSLQQIRSRNPRYIKGKNLMQYDGRLVLYNIRSENNINYQKQANAIKAYYVNYAIPNRYADQFKGLRPNENYWFGIQWNYIDGTSSVAFDVPGREPTSAELERIDTACRPCQLPVWRTKDTSKRTKLFLEDVHNTNGDYDDVITYEDNNRDSNYQDTDLDANEDDRIKTVPGDGPIDETTNLRTINTSFEAQLDCLCDKLAGLGLYGCTGLDVNCDQGGEDPCDPCDVGLDLMGKITLAELQCMCANRILVDIPTCSGVCADGEPCQSGCECVDGECQSATDDPPPPPPPDCSEEECFHGHCGEGCNCVDDICVPLPHLSESERVFEALGVLKSSLSSVGKYISYTNESEDVSVNGRTLEVEIKYAIAKAEKYYDVLTNRLNEGNPPDSGISLIRTNQPCEIEGAEECPGNYCRVCVDGFWHRKEGLNNYEVREAYKRESNNRQAEGAAKVPFSQNFSFEYVYDTDGCEIVGVRPSKYSQGEFGYWQTNEVYPYTKDCECNYIYGDLAGKPVRLHRVPTVAKEPYFVSFSGGVPNLYDMANVEDKNSFVFMMGVRFEGITPPKDLPKPLCQNNPYSIVYVERTEANKSVIGTGVAISTFKGEVQGEAFVFPKIGCNSFERFNRTIEPAGISSFRGGVEVSRSVDWDLIPANVSPYIIHSADFHFRQPPLDATDALFELELYGKGFRHGLYAEDIEAESFTYGKKNQKGTRQSLILNHFRLVRGATDGYLSRCVTSMSEVPADSNISKSDEFKYSLCNLWGESTTYAELEGPLTKFRDGDTDGMVDKYGGIAPHTGDEASDRSFTGDTLCHSMPIHDVRAHLVTFTRYLPYQYGSPITQTFIPLGLEGDSDSLGVGVSEGLAGDSFVGAVSFKRTSYVSDKTPRKLYKNLSSFEIPELGKTWRFIGAFLKFLFRSLGLKIGGYIPPSCDVNEPINKWGGLREQGDTYEKLADPDDVRWGEKKIGHIPLPKEPGGNPASTAQDKNNGDNYWAHLVKSNLWFWLNTDVNPAYRELGDPDNGEVYWPHLKGQRLDSSMPDRYDWRKAYLNRIFSFLEGNPKWKTLVVGLFLLLFDWGIGLWIIFQGVKDLVTGLQAIGGGTYGLQTIGGVFAAVAGIVLLAIGVIWIITWLHSDADNKMIEDIVQMKNLRPDVKNADGSYSIYDGKIKQFEDNYWSHNPDLQCTNRHEYCFGMSDVYKTCVCPEERSVEAPYSNKQNPVSPIDSWSNFKLNNTIKLPPDNGKISKIFKLGGKVFVHATDMLLDLQTGHRTATLDKGKLLLGSGDIFGNAEPIYGGVVEGCAGLSDPNSAYVTNWCYIFPDRKARKFYLFGGSAPEPISSAGVRGFMQDNMHFKLLDKFPDFKNVDIKSPTGIGYSIGVDHQHNRFLFTKIDYDVQDGVDVTYKDGMFKSGDKTVVLSDQKYFCNKSFTLSYNLETKQWISHHSYTPRLYAWDRFRMFSFDQHGMYRHNVKGKFQNFYGNREPFMVEFPVRAQSGDSFTSEAFVVDTEAYTWKGCDYLRNSKVTFDKMMAYNSYQNTGILDVELDSESVSILDRSRERRGSIRADYSHRVWLFNNQLNDVLLDPDELMFDCSCEIGPSQLRSGSTGSKTTSNQLKDNFMMYRFQFQSKDDTKLFFKKMKAKVDLDVGYF